MRDPDLVQRAEHAAVALERAWGRWREMHGLGADPPPPVSSYVGYSLEEPWGQPRVVFGLCAEEAERLAALLDGHDCVGPVHAEVSARPDWRNGAGGAPAALLTAGGIPAQAGPEETSSGVPEAVSKVGELGEAAITGPADRGSAAADEIAEAAAPAGAAAAGVPAGPAEEQMIGLNAAVASVPVVASLPRILPAGPLQPVAGHGRRSSGDQSAARHAAASAEPEADALLATGAPGGADGSTGTVATAAETGIVTFRPRLDPLPEQRASAGPAGEAGLTWQPTAPDADGADTGRPSQGPGYRGPRYRGFPPEYQIAEPGPAEAGDAAAGGREQAGSARADSTGSRPMSGLSRSWRPGSGGHKAAG